LDHVVTGSSKLHNSATLETNSNN